jgi:hypothetical protein
LTTGDYGPIPALREDRGRFAALRERRVLVYWPHGFGDWVHLGYILPLLEPSNRYAVTRYGDDYVSVMDGNAIAMPLHSGIVTPGDGSREGAAHLGLSLRRCNGKPAVVRLAQSLAANVAEFAPDALLWTDYPETEGRTAYPFHTKARNLVRLLVAPERLLAIDLSRPLRSSIDFNAPADAQRGVDERLARFAPPGTRLCVVSRRGVTAARKNWGDGTEVREFAALLGNESPAWRIISMDEEDLGERSAGFRALFTDLGMPFGVLLKALAARIELLVGVPAGPLHFTLARGSTAVVGLWFAHHPDWYDEPNPRALHLVGNYVRERRFDRRIASTSKPPQLQHRVEYLESNGAAARTVLEAALELTN